MTLRATLVLLVLLSGCSGLLGRGDWDPFRTADERTLNVTVQNQNQSSVRITVVSPSRRTSVGTVDGNSRSGFSVSWSSMQELRFELEATGGARQMTSAVFAAPGDRVELVIRNPLSQSAVIRR